MRDYSQILSSHASCSGHMLEPSADNDNCEYDKIIMTAYGRIGVTDTNFVYLDGEQS